MKFNRNWPHQRIEIGRLRTQFQCFGANFADRWPHWTGARLIKVHLHSKSFGGGGGGGGGCICIQNRSGGGGPKMAA